MFRYDAPGRLASNAKTAFLPGLPASKGDWLSFRQQMGEQAGDSAVDQRIARLAGRQHGVIGRYQLVGLGLGRGAIASRVRLGRLHLLFRGSYAVGHRSVSQLGRWMAAVLACGCGATLSYRSAAQLWRLIPLRRDAPIEVTRPRSSHARTGVTIHRARLATDEVALEEGIPVTSVARTLLDLGAVLSPEQLGRAFDKAETLQHTGPLSLRDLIDRYPRRPGNRALRRLLDSPEPTRVTRQQLEDRFLMFLDRSGFPLPETNVWTNVEGRWLELDCVWRSARLVVELDGFSTHGSRSSFEKDRERDRTLQAAGWRTIRITWRQLEHQPSQLLRDLRRLVSAAAIPD